MTLLLFKNKNKTSEVCFIFPSMIGREKIISVALIMTDLKVLPILLSTLTL